MSSSEVRVAVVGGGITGLAAAAWLEHEHAVRDVLVLEASEQAGGKVQTELVDGHCLEGGPQGFLDSAPDTLDLARRVGLEVDLVRAGDNSAARYILRAGKLRAVPMKPPAFLFSDILPLGAKLRVLGEGLARKRPTGDETVFDFAARRIGRTAAEVLVDAMVTGVWAGDARQLSLAATFPKMAAMEREHGSLTRAMLARMREARSSGRKAGGPSGPAGTLSTFREGMAQLPRRIAELLGDRLLLGAGVERIERTDGGFLLHGKSGRFAARTVLLAVPPKPAARLLEPLAPEAAPPLAAVPTVPIVVVMMSFSRPGDFAFPLEGFGFLVPSGEKLPILGTLFCHSIFPGQAPAGSALLRTMLGGARDPGAIELDDAAAVARVRAVHARVLGGDPEPDRLWISRHTDGIAQYTPGHLDRIAIVEAATRRIGLEVTGSPFRGVSVNDCIRQARDAARRIVARLQGGER